MEKKNIIGRNGLVKEIAKDAGLSQKTADSVVRALLDRLAAHIAAGDLVRLVGFGSFDTAETAAREIRNPKGETLQVPAHIRIRFHASDPLKKAANRKRK